MMIIKMKIFNLWKNLNMTMKNNIKIIKLMKKIKKMIYKKITLMSLNNMMKKYQMKNYYKA